MTRRVLAAVLAAFLMLPAFGLSAYASDYFDGPVSVADPPDSEDGSDETEPDCEIVDVTPRGEPVSGAITVTDNTEPTAPATEPTAPTEPVTEPITEPVTEPPTEPAADPVARPFTPSGTGETVDNAEDSDGKEFFTFTTPDENTFYLVIDRQRETENVYLLDAVTVTDLQSLAEAGLAPAPVATEPPTEPTEPEPTTEPPPEEEKGGGAGMIVLVVLALIGGGAAYYFKIYRPKQAQNDAGDFDAEEDYSEEPDPYGDIGADDWDSDDTAQSEESTE